MGEYYENSGQSAIAICSSDKPGRFCYCCGMAQPGTIQIADTETKVELETPWNVIVFNDPINLMSYVTLVFQRVFGYAKPKAELHMLEVHQKGRSLVWSGGREQAEHYVHQLHSYQLLAQLEKAER
jgi:ATP-dependent Clp protease adaptor protein ClpS